MSRHGWQRLNRVLHHVNAEPGCVCHGGHKGVAGCPLRQFIPGSASPITQVDKGRRYDAHGLDDIAGQVRGENHGFIRRPVPQCLLQVNPALHGEGVRKHGDVLTPLGVRVPALAVVALKPLCELLLIARISHL